MILSFCFLLLFLWIEARTLHGCGLASVVHLCVVHLCVVHLCVVHLCVVHLCVVHLCVLHLCVVHLCVVHFCVVHLCVVHLCMVHLHSTSLQWYYKSILSFSNSNSNSIKDNKPPKGSPRVTVCLGQVSAAQRAVQSSVAL